MSLLTNAAASAGANPLAALGVVQSVAKLGKGVYDAVQYRTGGQKAVDDRAIEIARDPSKAAVSIAEKRQQLGDAVYQNSQLANIQDPAEYSQKQAELKAQASGDVERNAQNRMRQTYSDALKTVEKADEAKEDRVENFISAGESAAKVGISKASGFSEDAMEALYGSDPELAERVRELEEALEEERSRAAASRSGTTP